MPQITEITPEIYNLVETYLASRPLSARADEPKIKVDQIISKLASAYEKLRNAVEYHEEHLLLRHAVLRIFKRRLSRGGTGKTVAGPLIEELIRAKYLPNDTLPENLINKVAAIIDRYVNFINLSLAGRTDKERQKIYNWAMEIASAELEENLVSHEKENALVEAMYKIISRELVYLETVDRREENIQTFVAIHKTLLKSDLPIIRYHLLKFFYPDWAASNENTIRQAAYYVDRLKKNIDKLITNKTVSYLERLIRPYSVLFLIFHDILEKNGPSAKAVLASPESLAGEIALACDSRYKKTKRILERSAVRSVIYIFLTKTVLALILELPYELYFLGSISLLPLGINVFFHPLLMIFIGASTRVPTHKNSQKIIEGLNWIVYGQGEAKIIFKPPKQRGALSLGGFLVVMLYSLSYLVSFGLIIWTLTLLNFNFISGFLFVLFLTFVSFFGIRLRKNARELVVIKRKENIITFLFDVLTLPIVRAGKWLSEHSAKINVFVFIMDFIIESPFKNLLEIFEQASSFIKQKKEEIY